MIDAPAGAVPARALLSPATIGGSNRQHLVQGGIVLAAAGNWQRLVERATYFPRGGLKFTP